MSNRDTHLAHPPHKEDAPPPPEHSGKAITLGKVAAYQGESIVVTSEAIDADGRIDALYSQAGDDVSPPLQWTPVQDAAVYALVVEDPDAPHEDPVVHWLIWNIPGELTALPARIAAAARPVTPQGAVQGQNGRGDFGWMGPKPPPGHGPHRYHFQLFALGERLEMGPETTLAELTNALKATAIVSGEVVGLFETPGG
jgi:Raf kinase inhibitor-like YbhB/YbcL family protein